MITFEKNFLSLTSEIQTRTKVNTLVVYFDTPSIGNIRSWLNGGLIEETSEGPGLIPLVRETETCILQRTDTDLIFKNKDILAELHTMFLTEISALNPDITFSIQLSSGVQPE